ncbi:MAG: acyl-ACP--UDP-N-acetylglucosamine O-acyltransferase [Thermoguttaceae bacterium]
MKAHPTAIISDEARIADDVEIGPFCVIESGVTIGPGCVLLPRVSVKKGVTLGENNTLHEGVVLGGKPQHICSHGEYGGVIIGNGNIFRENCTVHCAMYPEKNTILGDENFLMVNAHVAHDCVIGNHVIITNNAMLGGHVHVGDRANISGGVAIHQFCQIGMFAMVGGNSHIVQDVLPFVNVDGGTSLVVGVNLIGLRRAGVPNAEIKRIREAYRLLYEEKRPMQENIALMTKRFSEGMAAEYAEFLKASKRGFLPERRTSGKALKLVRVEETEKPAPQIPASQPDAPSEETPAIRAIG